MKILTLLSISFLLMSCGKTKKNFTGSDKVSENKPDMPPALENITDYSQCEQTRINGLEGEWLLHQRQGEKKIELTYRIYSGRVTIIGECSLREHSIIAQATAVAEYGNGAFNISSAVEQKLALEQDGVQLNCEVSLDTRAFRYQFDKGCLVLTPSDGGENIVLVPKPQE